MVRPREFTAVRTELALQRAWGPAEYDAKMAGFRATAERIENAAPGFKAMLAGTGLGNSADLIRLLWDQVERRSR